MTFHFDPTYQRDLPETYLELAPDPAPAPALVALNLELAGALGLDAAALEARGAEWFSGAALPEGATPIALAYAGHQFGGFSPMLGDGRAHLLGEFVTPEGARYDLQLKGSGRTPFSRGGDGKAVLGPMLREYLISEAMAALGVPTTRALAVTTTGEKVMRDGRALPGAVVARVAASHIRVGTFQFLAARGEAAKIIALADYAIARHYRDLTHLPETERYVAFFDAVAEAQAQLIAQWMGFGFIHGVMNTDNMAISGETIDYGPCAFMEGFAPGTVFSSIDRQGRYAWGNQPHILGWNLARLAETILPLFGGDEAAALERANAHLGRVTEVYRAAWHRVMRAKIGLESAEAEDAALIDDLLIALQGADWTLFFYHLPEAMAGDVSELQPLFEDFAAMEAWLARWRSRLSAGSRALMAKSNPAVIARNHQVEAALAAAVEGDLAPFEALLAAVQRPFEANAAFMQPAPASFGRYITYCGT